MQLADEHNSFSCCESNAIAVCYQRKVPAQRLGSSPSRGASADPRRVEPLACGERTWSNRLQVLFRWHCTNGGKLGANVGLTWHLRRLPFRRQSRLEVLIMAWLEQRGKQFHICFRLGAQRFKKSPKTMDPHEAESIVKRVGRRLGLIENGDVTIPDGCDLLTFLLNDGKGISPSAPVRVGCTVGQMFERFLAELPGGALENNTLYTLRLHLAHIQQCVGQASWDRSTGIRRLAELREPSQQEKWNARTHARRDNDPQRAGEFPHCLELGRPDGACSQGVPWKRIKVSRFSAIYVASCGRGFPKRSRTRSRKWRKLNMPKARRRIVRSPLLKPSVGPLLDRLRK